MKDSGYSHAPLIHWSKVQEEAAASTTEAEFSALTLAVKRTMLPGQAYLETIYEVPVKTEMCVDNSAALTVAESGNSKALSTCRNTGGSVLHLYEMFSGRGMRTE